MNEYESSNKYWVQVLGDKPIFVFPVRMLGGHELMALEIIKGCLTENADVRVLIEPTNHSLKKRLITECSMNFDAIVDLPTKQPKLEFVHSIFNVRLKQRLNVFFNTVLQRKYTSIFLVQGDIEIGSTIAEVLISKNINYISYLPYLHSAKLMHKRFSKVRDLYASYLLNRTKHIVTISEIFKSQIKEKNKICVVDVFRNRVRDLTFFKEKRASYLKKEREGLRKLKLTIIGRVSYKQKGHDIILSALKLLSPEQLSRIDLNIIGDGEDRSLFIQTCNEELPSLEYHMHGWTPEPWDLAYNSDYLFIPSRFEGVPLVMLEAIALDIPVIASDRDGMKEYLPSSQLFNTYQECSKLIVKCLNSNN